MFIVSRSLLDPGGTGNVTPENSVKNGLTQSNELLMRADRISMLLLYLLLTMIFRVFQVFDLGLDLDEYITCLAEQGQG